ncbi:hypothetical protein [Streptomyces sp. NPDC051211]|uniref:hypothetical protein n=1 Tax=Streptomyces sp. NPDC051211 TaxID=3154643 RepID=UPI00344CBAD4
MDFEHVGGPSWHIPNFLALIGGGMWLLDVRPMELIPSEISIPGEFTDPGILGPEYAGKTIPMRTVIRIGQDGGHVFDMHFTPPGRAERLADRVVYTRLKK